jgi:predicted Zn-dependent protease with MMP-like domain
MPMPRSRFAAPPSLDDIAEMAEQALATIPKSLRNRASGVVIQTLDFPDEETEREMELESPFDLLGLYVGTPFGDQSVTETRSHVDVIQLYRRPILDYWCESGENLAHLVRHVLIHEIGHHFGFSDEDMEALEEQGD